MATLVGHKTAYGAPTNDVEVKRVIYDFAEDGGATGALDVLTVDEDCILESCYAIVQTACTSGGSATLDLGIKGGDTDRFLDAVAVANLTANSVHAPPLIEGTPNTSNMPTRLAADDIIEQTIGTAALTAGKVEYVFVLRKQ